MICTACKTAADNGQQGEKVHTEAGCKGKSTCTCMHRTGEYPELYNLERIDGSVHRVE